jgi:hypothetical protein
MVPVIDWMNANSGAVTAAATVVLAVLTGVYVRATYGMMNFMRDQTNLLGQQTGLVRAQVDAQLEQAKDDRAREDAAAQIRLVLIESTARMPGHYNIRVANMGAPAQGVTFAPEGFDWTPRTLDYWNHAGVEPFGIGSVTDDPATTRRLDVYYSDRRSRSRITSYRLVRSGGLRLEEVPAAALQKGPFVPIFGPAGPPE